MTWPKQNKENQLLKWILTSYWLSRLDELCDVNDILLESPALPNPTHFLGWRRSVRIAKNNDLHDKWRNKILRILFRKNGNTFESVRVWTCSLASGFQLWQEKCLLQKFFRFRPFFVSRRNFSDHFLWKWTIIQKS